MSASPWVTLTPETAPQFVGASIEVRRDGGDVEAHEAGVTFRSMGIDWLQVGEGFGLHAWSNGLGMDGRWEVRQVGPVIDRDARAFAGGLS